MAERGRGVEVRLIGEVETIPVTASVGGLSRFGVVQILPWGEDSDGAVWIEGEQIPVAGDDAVRAALYGTLQDEVILWVAADAG